MGHAQPAEIRGGCVQVVRGGAVGAISVGVLAALTRPLVGVDLGRPAGLRRRLRSPTADSRGRIPEDVPLTRGGDGRHRLLVVANETVGGAALLEEIGRRCRGRDCEILVITPALAASRADHWASDIDEAIVLARQRMELSVIEIEQRLGPQGEGRDRRLGTQRRDRRRAAGLPRRRDRDLDPSAADLALARARRRRPRPRRDRPADHPRRRRPRRRGRRAAASRTSRFPVRLTDKTSADGSRGP